MALQINQYAVTETGPIDADSLFDIDAETAPATYESRKLPFSLLQTEVLGGLTSDNGLTKTGVNIQLGGNLIANTLVDGSVNANTLEFRAGESGVGNGLSTLKLNDTTGIINIEVGRSTDVLNEFIQDRKDVIGGIGRFTYRSPTTDDQNTIDYGSTGIILSTDDNLGGNAMKYTQFNGIGTFLGAANSLRYQDGSEGTAGHALISTDVNGSMGWSAITGGIYNGGGTIPAATVATVTDYINFNTGRVGINTTGLPTAAFTAQGISAGVDAINVKNAAGSVVTFKITAAASDNKATFLCGGNNSFDVTAAARFRTSSAGVAGFRLDDHNGNPIISTVASTTRVGIGLAVANHQFDVAGNVNTSTHYRVGGTQVVSAQGASVADATDAASAITQLNLVISRLEAHGLIATV